MAIEVMVQNIIDLTEDDSPPPITGEAQGNSRSQRPAFRSPRSSILDNGVTYRHTLPSFVPGVQRSREDSDSPENLDKWKPLQTQRLVNYSVPDSLDPRSSSGHKSQPSPLRTSLTRDPGPPNPSRHSHPTTSTQAQHRGSHACDSFVSLRKNATPNQTGPIVKHGAVGQNDSVRPNTAQRSVPGPLHGDRSEPRSHTNLLQPTPSDANSQVNDSHNAVRPDTVCKLSPDSSPDLDCVPARSRIQQARNNSPPSTTAPIQRKQRYSPPHQTLPPAKRPRLDERFASEAASKHARDTKPSVVIQSIEQYSSPLLSDSRRTDQTSDKLKQASRQPTTVTNTQGPESRHGIPYSHEEDELLAKLREQGHIWANIPAYFNGRTLASLQVRYSTKVKSAIYTKTKRQSSRLLAPAADTDTESPPVSRRRRGRPSNTLLFPDDDAVPVESGDQSIYKQESKKIEETQPQSPTATVPTKVNAQPAITRLLRYRELGASVACSRSRSDNLARIKDSAYSTIGPVRVFDDASGDVSTVAWSPDGKHFAAGAVALIDSDSMQYNKPRNLLLGERSGTIKELAEHHFPRPKVQKGVNALRSMHASQDPRLFTTVQMVAFSPCAKRMYSVAIDGKMNGYSIGEDMSDVKLAYSIPHDSPVDLLSVGTHGRVATGSRASYNNSIRVFTCDDNTAVQHFSVGQTKLSTSNAVYPSALKWGVTPNQSRYLLAGFAQETQRLYEEDDALDVLGETCMYDGMTGQRLTVHNIPRNVFDVCWNPNIGRTVFAVASVAGSGRLNPGMHSVVRLFAEHSDSYSMRSNIELECPARDINDVVYCPYDENVVAAGSTDGRIYIWDTRYTRVSQTPHRNYSHGSCLSILPHDRPRWEVDTGIRFLQWGSNHTSLFSGSSDGVVKRWNPYLAVENMHVKDVATFQSAIMSGAFSPDFSSLLIGEDQGRLNLLEVGNEDRSVRDMDRFKLIAAPEPPHEDDKPPYRELLDSGQIVFEHCGPLPIRQAVQNPAQPTDIQVGLSGRSPAGYTIQDLSTLRNKAAQFQKKLHKSRKEWKRTKQAMLPHKVKACKLDCNYTPYAYGEVDEEGAVPDTQRSLVRIPDALRTEQKLFTAGLVAKCSVCGQPAHPCERDERTEVKCERCSFACFRCEVPAVLSEARDRVRCDGCGLAWVADVLGYELVGTDEGGLYS